MRKTRPQAIDGGNRVNKPAILVTATTNNPQTAVGEVFVRIKKMRKDGNPSMTRKGEQIYTFALKHPEQWKVVDKYNITELIEKLNRPTKIEPAIGSYGVGGAERKDTLILRDRVRGCFLRGSDNGVTVRMRKLHGIPKNEKNDVADAVLIAIAPEESFAKLKVTSEKILMCRTDVKQSLENSEEAGWGDALANEAMSKISAKYIKKTYGADLATPVFIVSAYCAAKDPQCKTREDFERFCGLFACARRDGKKGVGGVISSNLSHHNDNPLNKKAARHIYAAVKSLATGVPLTHAGILN